MNFELNDEQTALADTLSRFVTDRYGAAERRAFADHPRGYDPAIWRELAELGLIALRQSEADGGLGGSAMDLHAAMQALGPGLLLDPWLPALIASRLFAALGTDTQRAQLLPELASGKTVLGFALAEPGLAHPLEQCATTARAERDGYVLQGEKIAVLGGGAERFLVVAGAERHLFLVPADVPGLTIRRYRAIDRSLMCDLVFTDVRVPADALLGACSEPLEGALAEAFIALAAEACGIIGKAIDDTLEYLELRRQFGVPLASFQVLQHRLADCAAEFELVRSMALKAALLADDPQASRGARLHAAFAAKAYVGRAARRIGEEMVQLHGAIGLTEELWVGRAFKRLLTIAALFGDERAQTAYAETLEPGEGSPLDAQLSDQDRAFRAEVRAFLDERLPQELRRNGRLTPGAFSQLEDWLGWQRILFDKGWLAYSWPAEHGGTGWSATQRYIFERECAFAHAPAMAAQGLRMLAPVLIRFGTEQQKAHFLPKILNAEHIWCQGYSEPDAGSDLASLKCRAVRGADSQGDYYIVDGSKIWTTYAHHANHIFCLVRTDPEAKKQSGISFLLIDMATPGISVQPIPLISGDREFNQVFFDNVRVPAANLVGAENDGWTIAKFLLEHERGGSCQAPGLLAALAELRDAAATLPGRDGGVLAQDRDFMHRLAMIEAEAQGMEMLELRLLSQLAGGSSPGPQTAIVGLLMANITQAIDALMVEAQGPRALELAERRPVPDYARLALPSYLNNRAWSIMAGSNEVMRTIIAKTVLRL